MDHGNSLRHLLLVIVAGFNSIIGRPATTQSTEVGALPATQPAPAELRVAIHNGLVDAPAGVAFVVNDQTAFAFDLGRAAGSAHQFLGSRWVESGSRPGLAAADFSFHEMVFDPEPPDNARVTWDWGRMENAIVGRVRADKATTLSIKLLRRTWPGFKCEIAPAPEGAAGSAKLPDGTPIEWRLISSPAPVNMPASRPSTIASSRPISSGDLLLTIKVSPGHDALIVAGIGELPALANVNPILDAAEQAYLGKRPSSQGMWGDFVGAIVDNQNNTRVYSSDLKMLADFGSRDWAHGVNKTPFFGWDSFFIGMMASLDDPKTAEDSIRGVLAAHALNDDPNDGMVPNYSHWSFDGSSESLDRSQPPVGAMGVWKMYQRWPDKAFLAEVYPKLKKWHEWWPRHRDGLHDGLLEWGCDAKKLKGSNPMQGAKWETGWDDTIEFEGAKMVGSTMNAYAVDLNALYSMDAEYLSRIADALGRVADANMFRAQQAEMNRRINVTLWNEQLGTYCSRLWGENGKPGAFLTRLTPMNFYPMICSAPTPARADRMLKLLTDPKRFWGRWKLPTVAYDDPVYSSQVYWRGNVWGPVNYLVFQGLKRYASPELRHEFARNSVDLFMRNWEIAGACGENYLSTTGAQATTHSDRNYTWGALLCMVGLEDVIDTDDAGHLVMGSALREDVTLRQIPIGGVRYRVDVREGQATAMREGD
jgi:hypothetical protein